jgi:hypothetical protein
MPLVMALDGQIVEQTNERPLLAALVGGGDIARQTPRSATSLKALERARTDARSKAVVLELDLHRRRSDQFADDWPRAGRGSTTVKHLCHRIYR